MLFDQRATCNPGLEWRLHSSFVERIFMVTLEEARRVIEAGERKASEIRQPMNIAVVDEGGNLCFPRSHGRRLDRQHRYLY